MRSLIHVPATLEDAKTALDGIGKLLTAKRWERAAIVYAFTTNNGRGGDHSKRVNTRLPMAEFAALGLIGLTDEHRVAQYRRAWEKAADKVAESDAHYADEMRDLGPDESIEMPDLAWKDFYGEPTIEVQARVAKAHILKNPGVVAEAMRASEHVQESVARDIAHDEELSGAVGRASFAKRIGVDHIRKVAPGIVPTRDRDKEMHEALLVVGQLLRDESEGLFAVSGIVEAQLRILAIILDRRAAKADEQDVMVHIEEFLATARKEV